MKNKLKNKMMVAIKRLQKTTSPWTAFFYSLFAITIMISSGCSKNGDHAHSQEYICPMHPTILQDRPGMCPVCGMDLVLKGKPGEELEITNDLNYLLKPTNVSVVGSIKMITPISKFENINSETNGVITYDTRRITTIPIRISGRIEKLMIKYNFQPIRKGEKILEIYSPELLTVQRDLIYLHESDVENTQLIESAKVKLRLLGISNQQIAQIISTKKEMYSFPVYSSVNGYIFQEDALQTSTPSISSSATSGMNSGSAMTSSLQSKSVASEIQIREGMYVTTGQNLFKVVNTDHVWAEFNIRQNIASNIKLNDSISILFDPSKQETHSTISFIQPFYQVGESFTKMRVYLSNPENTYQIGQLIKATIKTKSKKSLWVPNTASLDLGIQKIVFTKRNGTFRPKVISTGQSSKNWIEVIAGLEAQDSLAYDAQFLMDSDGFIKVKN